MRLMLAAALLVATPALAQTTLPGTTTVGEPPRRAIPTVTDAPVPSVMPPSATNAEPSSVPEQISPPGAGSTNAGPADSTPFSGAPSGTLPGDAGDSSNRSGTVPGNLGGTPNLSK